MGLPSFHSPAEGVLPLLVMNTVMSVAMVMNLLKSMLHVMGAVGTDREIEEECHGDESRARRVSITRYGSLCRNRGGGGSGRAMECCVCLCNFKDSEEVSELSCKHFFHKACLAKWFDNQNITCPLCRSIV
ncbi:hypothetical protein ACJIZ3_005192 [Penstemon smallii]|uniref:RING-type domain-containing protein n=1 Tax=Penstemon smallii TaxID=265156 RepID=A0ABD3S4B5_9LAMI